MALALTSRRRALAAGASAITAVVLAAAVAGRSCQVAGAGPEDVVREMLAAARAGDRASVHELLSPQTRERLTQAAQRATDLVGASIRYTALDMISIGSTDAPAPTDVTVVERLGDTAVVELVGPSGRARVRTVKVGARWRIELPDYAP
ncbi:MAG: hypothetical protein KBG28_31835 [Kofleriaceae bacterium]|jgi:hypothetical protein|nr:hypothetical protein [Kofleriaceae bacterium]MBP9208601.1 hypothetical protein [Kofleriaceae bacterium]